MVPVTVRSCARLNPPGGRAAVDYDLGAFGVRGWLLEQQFDGIWAGGVTLKPGRATVSAMSRLDLERIGRSVVKLRADVPEDAFTAGILGSQRTGNGVVIDSNGLILKIGRASCRERV